MGWGGGGWWRRGGWWWLVGGGGWWGWWWCHDVSNRRQLNSSFVANDQQYCNHFSCYYVVMFCFRAITQVWENIQIHHWRKHPACPSCYIFISDVCWIVVAVTLCYWSCLWESVVLFNYVRVLILGDVMEYSMAGTPLASNICGPVTVNGIIPPTCVYIRVWIINYSIVFWDMYLPIHVLTAMAAFLLPSLPYHNFNISLLKFSFNLRHV